MAAAAVERQSAGRAMAGDWRQLSPAAQPPGRSGHRQTFDPARGRTVLTGGMHNLADDGFTLALHMAFWSQAPPALLQNQDAIAATFRWVERKPLREVPPEDRWLGRRMDLADRQDWQALPAAERGRLRKESERRMHEAALQHLPPGWHKRATRRSWCCPTRRPLRTSATSTCWSRSQTRWRRTSAR